MSCPGDVMRIVADADILTLDENFSRFGELVKIPGRAISRDHLIDADALLVRSITPVNSQLLNNTSVKFVGSATSGTDHIDLDYLQIRNIMFSDARGTNASAVVEYCLTALSIIAINQNINFFDKYISIVGAGNVGGLLARTLVALGYRCVICDPFLSERKRQEYIELQIPLVDFSEAMQADILSMHVPLTHSGDYPTFHLLNADNLPNLVTDCILLNTSRGAVIDNAALRRTLEKRRDLTVVLDVWESEPEIDVELLDNVYLGTPHIAGYSMEAKYGATRKLQRDFCTCFKLKSDVDAGLPSNTVQLTKAAESVNKSAKSILELELLAQLLPLEKVTGQFRNLANDAESSAENVFDRLRIQLATRHEFGTVALKASNLSTQQQAQLAMLGFKLT